MGGTRLRLRGGQAQAGRWRGPGPIAMSTTGAYGCLSPRATQPDLGYVRAMATPRPDPWVALWRRLPQARARLFCFPFAGGGASAFRTWVKPLADQHIDVVPVQLPGREARLIEPALTRIDAVAAA